VRDAARGRRPGARRGAALGARRGGGAAGGAGRGARRGRGGRRRRERAVARSRARGPAHHAHRRRAAGRVPDPAGAAGRPAGRAGGRLWGRGIGVGVGGGGGRGLAQLGVLAGLEFLGVPVDVLVGSSIGATIAGFYLADGLAATTELLARFRTPASALRLLA